MQEKLTQLANKLGYSLRPDLPEDVILDLILNQLEYVPYIPFPVAISTVDIALVHHSNSGVQVLLGRKQDQAKWQFPGGFMDPGETRQEAASRELFEETGIDLDPFRFKMVDDYPIDDNRYKNSCHKIMTTLMLVDLDDETPPEPAAQDDLAELKWFNVEEIYAAGKENYIREVHMDLFEYAMSKVVIV